jgi:hypothetical protein
MSAPGVNVQPLDTEVWYRVEVSGKGDDCWNSTSSGDFTDMIRAHCSIERNITDGTYDTDEYEYRIVRVTTQTEVVSYAPVTA